MTETGIMTSRMYKTVKTMIITGIFLTLSACASQTTLESGIKSANVDPLEPANRKVYAFNDGLDRILVKPLAKGYAALTPDMMQTGITNFFDNLGYLNVIVNSSLQGKLDQSLSDIFRFLFNSTLGVAGLFDVATPMGLVAHEEDLGQTFAVWGSGQGAYLTVPIFGPNTIRDAPDLVTRWLLDPVNYLATAVSLPATALYVINLRANLLDATHVVDDAALDPYSFVRDSYLQRRNYLIFDGSPPTDSNDDIFGDGNL